MPETTTPEGVPARILAEAKKNPTFKTLVEAWDPEAGFAEREITYGEAVDLERDLFPRRPRQLPHPFLGSTKEFPLGDWTLRLIYSGVFNQLDRVAAFLGPARAIPREE